MAKVRTFTGGEFDLDTDILTSSGWIPVAEISEGTSALIVDRAGKLCESVVLHSKPGGLSKRLVEISSRTLKIVVSPETRLHLRGKHSLQAGALKAEDLLTRRAHKSDYFTMNNKPDSNNQMPPSMISVPSITYKRAYCAKPLPDFTSSDWAEFMGWYLSEGNTTYYRDRSEVMIAQTKPEHLDTISTLLKRMGFSGKHSRKAFVVCNKQLASYTEQFGYAHQKFIPRELFNYDEPAMRALYISLMRGDGHVRTRLASSRDEDHQYITCSKQLADDVQELMIRLGNMANIQHRKRNIQKPNWRQQYVVHRRTSEESSIWPQRHVSLTDARPYQEVGVGDGILITRHSSKASACCLAVASS